MDRAIVELREDFEHERDGRYALTDSMRKNHKDRADYILAPGRAGCPLPR